MNEVYTDFEKKKITKISWKTWFYLVFSILFLILLIDGCEKSKEIERLEKLNEFNVAYYKDSLNRVIAAANAKEIQNQQVMKDLRAKLFETEDKYNKKVKEVKVLVSQKTRVKVDSLLVPYIDSGKIKNWEDSVLANCKDVINYYEDSTVLIGTTAKIDDKWYNMELAVEKEGIMVNSIQFVDSQYLAISRFKGGILKRDINKKLKLYEPERIRVEVKHTNPYFKNEGINSFYYVPKKKHNFLKGLLVGAGIMLRLK